MSSDDERLMDAALNAGPFAALAAITRLAEGLTPQALAALRKSPVVEFDRFMAAVGSLHCRCHETRPAEPAEDKADG